MAADSCVNFQHLTDQEQIERFTNMRHEYFRLKKSVGILAEESFKNMQAKRDRFAPVYIKSERDYLSAQKKLGSHQFEIPDSQKVL